jgi:hypothetical protein
LSEILQLVRMIQRDSRRQKTYFKNILAANKEVQEKVWRS